MFTNNTIVTMESNFNNIVIQFNDNNNQMNVNSDNCFRNESIAELDARFDLFHCGKCGLNFGTIDGFVFHKLSEESVDIYYEENNINGKLVKIPKLYQKDIRHDSTDLKNHQNLNHNKCVNNNSSDEKSNQSKSIEMSESGHQLISNNKTEEVEEVKEELKQNPIVTIIIEGQKNKKLYNCNECKKMFTQKSRAVRHLESVHDWDFDSLKRIINKSINTKDSNNDESNSCGESSVPQWMRRVECDKCGANVKGKRALKVHQLTHSEERTFSCPYNGCSFMFKTKGSMQRHIRRHTNERPFKCDLCERTFRESGALTRHLKSRYVCINKSDSDLPNYGKARALPLIDSIIKKS